jgi:peptidoglycan hydrolase CwlO-like protein
MSDQQIEYLKGQISELNLKIYDQEEELESLREELQEANEELVYWSNR